MAYRRQWLYKARSPGMRTFLAQDSLVIFAGKKVLSVDAATGKERAAEKWAMCGEPWVENGEVWIPTAKSFVVRDAHTLDVKRELVIGKPKAQSKGENPAYMGTLDGLYDGDAVRLAKSKNLVEVDGARVHRFYLARFAVGAKKPVFQTVVAETTAQIVGAFADGVAVCAWSDEGDGVVAAFSGDDGRELTRARVGDVQWVKRQAGFITAVCRDWSGVVLVPGPSGVARNGGFRDLPPLRRIERHGDYRYGISHREILRLDDDCEVVARRAVTTPASPADIAFRAPASVAAEGDKLRLVERVAPIPDHTSPKDPDKIAYTTRLIDAVTLEDAGPGEDFEEEPTFTLQGRSDGQVAVATARGHWVGCTF